MVQDQLSFGFDESAFEQVAAKPSVPVLKAVMKALQSSRQSSPETFVPKRVALYFSQPDAFSEYLAAEQTGSRFFIDGFTRATVQAAPQLPATVNAHTGDDVDDESTEDFTAEEQESDSSDLDAQLGWSEDQLRREQSQWNPTENEVQWLHVTCLDENLAFLLSKDRKPRVAFEKGRILQWIFTCDDIAGVHVSKIPFSYHNCCLAAGMRPDELRSGLLQLPVVRSLLVNLKLYEERQLPRLRKKVLYSDIAGPDASPNHPVYMSGV